MPSSWQKNFLVSMNLICGINMKKYIIKNSDGSEQHVMRAIHSSERNAWKTIWNYICEYNDKFYNHEKWLTHHDFTVEEADCEDEAPTITGFYKAQKYLGLYPNEMDVIAQKGSLLTESHLTEIRQFVTEFNPKHIEALIALNKLFTIAQAWNKEDGFVPDFSDWEQDKYFPWFRYDDDAAGFVFAVTNHPPTHASASFGSRLCFKSSSRAEQFGRQFADLYNKIFL